MIKVKDWVENEFNPWKQAMIDYKDETKRSIFIVQKNAAELKYIVSLLMEKREAEAVKIWNDLELNPALDAIKFNIENDELIMNLKNGESMTLSISSLLNELEEMVNL